MSAAPRKMAVSAPPRAPTAEPDSADLPPGWEYVPLGKLTRPTRPRRNPQDRPKLPYVGMEEVESNTRRLLRTVSAAEMKSTAFHFLPGDVLYGRLRPYLNKVHCATIEGLCSSEFIVLPPEPSFDPAFLSFYLSTDQFVAFANSLNQGDRPRVSFDQIAEHSIPLPPLAEQRRIVAKLEELLGKVEASRQRLAPVPALLKRFRQAVLAAACSGRLTADWREDAPCIEPEDRAAKILDRATKFWIQSGRKGQVPEIDQAKIADLPDLPANWCWAPLGILGENPLETVQTGPFGALLHRTEFKPSGVPVVAVGNLTGMGFTQEGLYFVSPEKAHQLSRFDIQAGDVLFARSGATLGKVCVAPKEAKNWRMTGHILRTRLHQPFILPEYCVFALRGDPTVTSQVFGNVQGTTRPGYNTTLLESIALPLPPLPEQEEIVRRVEALFAVADRLEARFETARAQVDRLAPALLAKAFRGELVPQDPRDPPASALLAQLPEAK